MKKYILLAVFLFMFSNEALHAQVNSFAGVSLAPGFGSVRSPNASYTLGYSGGLDYILWEYPEWYLKTGLHVGFRNSNIREIPKYHDVPADQRFIPVDMTYAERNIMIPIQGFFPLLNRKDNALLLGAGLEMMYTLQENYILDNYGKVSIGTSDIDKPFKTGITVGAGYQREISDLLFFSVYPSINLDVKADRAFTSFELVLELFYGVY